MDDIFWALVGNLIIFWCGYKLGQHHTAYKITKMLINRDPNLERQIERARNEIQRLNSQDDATEAYEELEVERHGGQIYLFNKADREFLAQGSTLQEALDRIEKRFPGRKFQGHLNKDQATALGVGVE